MIKYVLKENKNKKSLAFGKWYAFPVVDETIDLSDLAKHMEEHNTGFSEAMCLGMMTAMVKCVKEQLLAGKNVNIKIPHFAALASDIFCIFAAQNINS